MMDAEQAKQLRKPFPASAIGQLPKAGMMLDYVGHAATTDRLLEVDPEWTWEPFALDHAGLPALDDAGNLWIRLTVCGVTRPGVGDGKHMKERIGDAIRNAAMRFGVALDLWAKEDLHANGDAAAASLMERQKQRIQARATPPPPPVEPDDVEFGQPIEVVLVGNEPAGPATITAAQAKKLNVLVGTLRDQGRLRTIQLYAAISRSRNVDTDTMAELLGGVDENGDLHWAPLRNSLTKAEASDLIERLSRLEQNAKATEEPQP